MENAIVPPSGKTPVAASTPHVKPKIGGNFLSCALLAIVFVALLGSALAYLVSETGLVRIPFFSMWYEGPQSVHRVAIEKVDGKQLQDRIIKDLQGQIANNKGGPYVVRLTEGELSGVLISSLLKEMGGQMSDEHPNQVAVRQDGLEFLGTLTQGPLHVHFIALLKPVLERGVLSFVVQSVQIGDFQLPPSWAVKVMSYLLSRDMAMFNISFGKDVLKEIRLFDGYLEIETNIPS